MPELAGISTQSELADGLLLKNATGAAFALEHGAF